QVVQRVAERRVESHAVAAGADRRGAPQPGVPAPHPGVADDARVGQDLTDLRGAGTLGDLDHHLLAGAARGVDLPLHPRPREPAGRHGDQREHGQHDQGVAAAPPAGQLVLVLIELAVLVAVDVVGVAVVAVGVVGPGTGVPGLVVRRGRAVAGRLVVGRVRTVAPAAVAGRDTRRLAGGVEDDLHRLRRLVDMRPPRRL